MRASVADAFRSGDALNIRGMAFRAHDFVESLRHRRPAFVGAGQRCGMDTPDQIALDLKGHVMTCHNTGAQGRHRIGELLAGRSTLCGWTLPRETGRRHGESCTHCPVLQLCKGSCMYLEGDLFAQSCENEYQFNLAVLGAVLHELTGLTLQSVGGDIRRPNCGHDPAGGGL